ncbi:integrin alpha-X-like [Crotalus adamanteus]|uniref:Integrin alpha-X-like n=1 Tax=Crotalus adamanteus TaxID=8729 RepID=A0AAW1B6C5_CROAD
MSQEGLSALLIPPVQFNGRNGLVVGAPRYDHIGKIVYFENEALSGEWQLKMEAVGEQKEAFSCTDSNTALKGEPGHLFGRFGTSMAEVGDITGDKWTDVAIGAPLEDENAGAVYIFSGKRASIKRSYVQRIAGLKFSGQFSYFGQALSGGRDLTGDGLKDITVGQQGRVLLMRSRPVLQVKVSIMFHPSSIPILVFQWQRPTSQENVASVAEVCFTVSKVTQDFLDEIHSELSYRLTLDSHRIKARASFTSKSPILQANISIGLERKCQKHQIELSVGTEDTLTPITLRLNYNLTGKSIAKVPDLLPILSKQSKQNYTAELPFEKNCGDDGLCEDILQTSFTFSGLQTLDVGLTPEFTITASLQNHGEDSYRSTLRFFYPAGLSYRKVTLLQQVSRKVTRVQCHSAPALEEEASRNATCNINHPIFWSGAEAIFVATFDVFPDADLGNTLQIMVKAESENGNTSTKDISYEATLPVRYAVYLLINMGEESTKYVNFTVGQEDAQKSVEHRYEPEFAMCVLERETSASKDLPANEAQLQLDCSVASCKIIRCDVLSLKVHKRPLEFGIKGDLSFTWTSQIQQKKIILVQTVVELVKIYNSFPVIIGSSFGGLILLALTATALYKVGFFKRQYKQMLEEAGADHAITPPSQNVESSPPSNDTVS